uniref:Pentraxin (PTX) domain-containing protein n=1 Tax=Astyanax mexicanus TaxID=7994 RepID=A0A3B1IDN7_ASTMX
SISFLYILISLFINNNIYSYLLYIFISALNTIVFPQASANSYVKLIPLKPLSLDAFTLCMRLSVDPDVVNQPKRETILFAYRTQNADELNVWQEKGKISFYLSSSGDGSSTGLAAFWVDGKRSTLQVYKQGHQVQSGGAVLLGQDPDSYLGDFDINQSFVGEITDVNMWDSVLTGSQIRHFNEKEWVGPTANVLNWSTMQYEVKGNAIVAPEKYI